jgi:hypothetical protein
MRVCCFPVLWLPASFAGLLGIVSLTACLEDDTSDIPDYETEVEILAFVESAETRGIVASHQLGDESRELARELGLPIEATGGLAVADVDSDDDDDILVVGGDDGSKLFLNDGRGEFTDATAEFEIELPATSSGPLFVDVDGDRDTDLVVADWLTGAVSIYENDGAGFELMDSGELGMPSAPAVAVAAGDADGDSDQDLLVARFGRGEPEALLWLNDGAGHFDDHTNAIHGLAQLDTEAWSFSSPLAHDVDRDGDVDWLVASNNSSFILLNETEEADAPRFEATRLEASASALSATLADLNNDGRLDWLLAGVEVELSDRGPSSTNGGSSAADAGSDSDAGSREGGIALDAGTGVVTADAGARSLLDYVWQSSDNQLFIHDRESSFDPWPAQSDVNEPGGPATCIADFNNDGLPDVFQASSRLGGAEGMHLYLQLTDGSGSFVDAADEVGLDRGDDGRAAVCFDYDRDGDVDIFVFNHESEARLYRNRLDPSGGPAFFLEVRLVGSEEAPAVAGARVSIVAGNTVQTREVMLGSGHLAQGSSAAHFGLQAIESVPQLRIQWPDGAEDTLIDDPPINDFLRIKRR